MRFDPGKVWPHPVLRPPNCGDDYPYAEFEVEIEVKREQNSRSLHISATFELSDPDLLSLVQDGKAKYALLIKASKTHFREMISSKTPNIGKSISGGHLSGRVEFASLLVCTADLFEFRAKGWHQDFEGREFNISSGSVLAEDVTKEYWVDMADEAPIGSIFGHKSRPDVPEGRWELELEDDHVWIAMSESDAKLYTAARDQANNQPEGQYLMNGLYLPALISVLYEADLNPEDYAERRWFASLDNRLEAVGCRKLGAGSNRFLDAQKIFEEPFAKMPVIAEALANNS